MNSITPKTRLAMTGAILALAALAALILYAPWRDAAPLAAAKNANSPNGDAGRPKPHDDGHAAGAAIVALDPAQISGAGIIVAQAGPAHIGAASQLAGEIRFNEDRTAHVVPRLAGVVDSVAATLGQQVKKGQLLAVISSTALSELRSELLAAQQRRALAQTTYEREKKLWQDNISAEQDYLQAQQYLRETEIAEQNALQKLRALGATAAAAGSLSRYELRAPFDGMIVEKHIALGEAVKEDANVFTLSDLSAVWAEIVVAPRDLELVRVGASVTVRATALSSVARGTVSYVGALLGEQTRTAKARVTLQNPAMTWRPGLFVNVELAPDGGAVPVAVLAEALHSVEGQPTVFVRVDGGFRPQPVASGRGDGKYIEIVHGMAAGTAYAAAGSFVIKAEMGKGEADHEH